MRLRRLLNAVFICLASVCLVRGFGVSWQVSVLPLSAAICGAVMGCVPGLLFSAINISCSIAGAIGLWFGMFVAAGVSVFLMFGDSTVAVARSGYDAEWLGFMGLLACCSAALAGWDVVRRQRSCSVGS